MATKRRPTGEKESVEARRVRVMAYRIRGLSTRQIAAHERCNASTICRDIQIMLERYSHEQESETSEYRTLELARLDKLFLSVWKDATDKKNKSRTFYIDRALSIMERRAKLLGLDAPLHIKMENVMPDEVVQALKTLGMTPAEAFQGLLEAARLKSEQAKLEAQK